MTGDHWFTPKTYGYGATPSDWRGWAATIGFVVASVVVALPMLPTTSRSVGSSGRFF